MFVTINYNRLVKHDLASILVLCILFFTDINAYPVLGQGRAIESGERTFPNGTVIGKYAYLDKEGNPVQVKYYADESSYGVELNSIKMVHKDGSHGLDKPQKQLEEALHEKKQEQGPFRGQVKENSNEEAKTNDLVNSFKYPTPQPAQKYNAPKEYQEAENNEPGTFPVKTVHQKGKYMGPDYEIYTKNELKNPSQQCDSNKEKVRVYNFVKEARRARESTEDEDEAQFCGF